VRRESIEKLCPFSRTAGVVKSPVTRIASSGSCTWISSNRARLAGASRPSRAGSPALDPEAVPLAYDVDVGQMRHAPRSAALRQSIKGREIASCAIVASAMPHMNAAPPK